MQALEEVPALREALQQSRAEALSLRLDLAEAHGFVEALEAELWASAAGRRCSRQARAAEELSPLTLLLHARTLLRRALFQQLVLPHDKAVAMHDLRIAEVAFRFLLELRSLHVHRA